MPGAGSATKNAEVGVRRPGATRSGESAPTVDGVRRLNATTGQRLGRTARSVGAAGLVAVVVVLGLVGCSSNNEGGGSDPDAIDDLSSVPPLLTTTTSVNMAEGASAAPPTALAPATVPSLPAAQPSTAASSATGPPVTVAPGASTTPATAAATGVLTTLPTRPPWLGTRVLALRPDGYGEMPPTPPELADRRFATSDFLAPPINDAFVSNIAEIPADVVARSSWRDDCPVSLAELRYVTVSFRGFDGLDHTGELLVNADAAEGFVEVFRRLHESRFPIEEMRVVTADEIDAPPTGDGNNTSVFACRPATGSTTTWSQHAYGRAIDINPFINPYLKGDIVLPELASVYLDRADVRPGMIVAGDVVTKAFADIGWGWGGNWNSLKDWQHFSANGR